jgi:hypothetical protein
MFDIGDTTNSSTTEEGDGLTVAAAVLDDTTFSVVGDLYPDQA